MDNFSQQPNYINNENNPANSNANSYNPANSSSNNPANSSSNNPANANSNQAPYESANANGYANIYNYLNTSSNTSANSNSSTNASAGSNASGNSNTNESASIDSYANVDNYANASNSSNVSAPTNATNTVNEPVSALPIPQKKTRSSAVESSGATLKQSPKETIKKKKRVKKKKFEESRQLYISKSTAPFAFKEAYKALRTNINFISSTDDIKTIVLTSAIPRESKSNVAINLAFTMATEGKRVIIVDCDLRKPALHRYLNLGRNVKGVTDVLANKADINDAIIHFKDTKIYVLPAGTIPPNPSEMLAQDRMNKLIQLLRDNYDFVILDAPPISVVTDAAILGRYVDGAILVVRSKFAPRETVQLAKKKLEDVGVNILGVVLTCYNSKSATKNSAYSYTYGYGYDYSGEG